MNKDQIEQVIVEVVTDKHGGWAADNYDGTITAVAEKLAEALEAQRQADLDKLVKLGVRYYGGYATEDTVRNEIERALNEPNLTVVKDTEEEVADVDYGPVDVEPKGDVEENDTEEGPEPDPATDEVPEGDADETLQSMEEAFAEASEHTSHPEQESDKSDEPSSQLDRIETRLIAVSGDVEALLALAHKLRKQGKKLIRTADKLDAGILG